MRTHLPKLMLLGVGGGIAAFIYSLRRSNGRSELLPADPADPVQSFDELTPLQLDALDLDAMSLVDADSDVEQASVETSMEEQAMQAGEPDPEPIHDVGDLYGLHTPRAEDREHPDEDAAMNDGENWIEALEASATEYGPVPETDLDSIVDDDDVYGAPHASDSEDTPVADRGSGGPSGL